MYFIGSHYIILIRICKLIFVVYYSIFDDKGEVKRLVESLIRDRDPDASVDRLRKMDFSYVFILFKKGKTKEVELTRTEIEACWQWRKGNIDETLKKKIENTIAEL
jgi:hypothetical protein